MTVAEMMEFLDATNPEKMMSEPVTCDVCGKVGRRKRGFLCPDDWYYMESAVDGETVIIYACSESCQTIPWLRGPGAFQKQEDGTRENPYTTMQENGGCKQKWCKCCSCHGVWTCTPLTDFHTRPGHGELLFCLTCVMTKGEPRT